MAGRTGRNHQPAAAESERASRRLLDLDCKKALLVYYNRLEVERERGTSGTAQRPLAETDFTIRLSADAAKKLARLDRRIIYRIERNERIVRVEALQPRGQVYRRI